MNRILLGSMAVAGLVASVNVIAIEEPAYDIYTCEGATFAGGYDVNISTDAPYAGIWYQVEDDADGACEDFKNDDPDFACNRRGDGNLVTSRIDDDTDPDMPRDFDQYNSGADLYVSGTEVAGDPTFAMVHADVFVPGACATQFSCDHDGDALEAEPTPEVPCFDSGFGGGSYEGGFFATALEACAETFDNTSEGFWAELNEGGGTISPNRNPKKTSNMNWAMFLMLTAPECQGDVAVDWGSAPPTCDQVDVVRNGIVDGGDYFLDGGVVAGEVTFTPATNCAPTYKCESLDGTVCLEE